MKTINRTQEIITEIIMRLTLRAELARTHIRAAHQRAEMYPFQAKKELGIKRS